jgi:hypothetical protein
MVAESVLHKLYGMICIVFVVAWPSDEYPKQQLLQSGAE